MNGTGDVPKKILHTKMDQNQMDTPNYKEYIRGAIGEKYTKTRTRRIEAAGDFFVIVEPYL